MSDLEPTCGWGRYPIQGAHVQRAYWRSDLMAAIGQVSLAQAQLRSYGDAALASRVVRTGPLSRLLGFDAEAGVLHVEAGARLDDILRFIVPRGWFLPVTPGTKHPSIGGCVAADVHGKNHHADGSIASHVESLEIVTADGCSRRCAADDDADLFWATLGGMGLTGFIYAVRLKLLPIESSQMTTVTRRTGDLAETCAVLRETQDDHRYSVAWVDLVHRRRRGRGLVMLGDHATEGDRALHGDGGLPVPRLPAQLMSRWPLRLGNGLYYRRQLRRCTSARQHYDPFFYPLDGLREWNRVYGRRGFLQYQFVIPYDDAVQTIDRFLDRVADAGSCALAVLKTMGAGRTGPLGFPMPGWTLALDYRRTDRIVAALQEATALIAEAGGRVYLAKDAILPSQYLPRMYPRLSEFLALRERVDPSRRLRSALSDRLQIT